jgi:hypothetical protein
MDNTDAQNLTLNGTTLEISGGNNADLSSLQDGTGTDDQNIANLGLVSTTLTVGIENGTSQSVDLAGLQDGYEANTDNQQISRTGLTVTLTNGGTYQDSINTYTAGTGIDITNNVVKTIKPKFYLGQDTLGGIVYHIYLGANGEQHGLIVSKTEATSTKWQNTGVLVNANRTEDGNYNMNLMSDSPAKGWITTNFDANWYLPSIDELSLLWHNRFYANKALRAGGFTLLAYNTYYWSSTEYNVDYAFYFVFSTGFSDHSYKNLPYSVRSVRAF